MDRNSIVGILIITTILIIWGVFNKPNKEELEKAKRRQDSLEMVRQQQAKETSSRTLPVKVDSLAGTTTPTVAKTPINNNVSAEVLKEQLGIFASAGKGEEKFVTLENNLIKLKLSTKGGRPYSVRLKNYRTYDSLPLILFSGDSVKFGMNFYLNNKPISTNQLYFQPVGNISDVIVSNSADSVSMLLDAGDGRSIEYTYSLKPNTYEVDFNIHLSGMQDISTREQNAIDLEWSYYSPKQERGAKNEDYYTTIYFKPDGEDVDYFNARSSKDSKEQDITTKVNWIAFKDQFFSSVLIGQPAFANAFVKYTNLPDNPKFLKIFDAEIGIPFNRTVKEAIPMKFYFGPNKFRALKKQYGDLQLQDLVTVGHGIIKWINQYVIIVLFDFLSKYIGNYGIIILLMTIIIKLVLYPLTFRSYLSQAKMRVLKPQIDEINKKIPKEKAMERQQATMALYKKVGVSPLGGCLPMILQLPILYAMFRFFPTSIELRQQSFLWATDLSTYDSILSWHAQIPIISSIYGNHISLFTLLMTLSSILTMNLNNQATSTQQMPGMKGMMYVMPVMFMFILNNWSAGLTYYYFLANVITFGQNMLSKAFIDEEELLKKMHAKKAKPVKKSGFQSRLEQMAKQRGYNTPKKK